MAVFAPMPSARESTATTVNPGARRNVRRANRRSFPMLSDRIAPRAGHRRNRGTYRRNTARFGSSVTFAGAAVTGTLNDAGELPDCTQCVIARPRAT